jgi:hypothetical protein
MSRVELMATEDQAGISVDAAEAQVIIRFARQGPVAASLKIGDGPEEMLGSDG